MHFKGVNNEVHFKGLVGLRTLSSSLQCSHVTRHVEILLCKAFRAMRFLNTIFQLHKLVIKTYRAKVSTADSSNVVDGKVTLVAVMQKSWFSLTNEVFLISKK